MINKVWFTSSCICIETDDGKMYSKSLEAFPILFNATEQQRLDYEIGKFGDDIRWLSIDEDIHISSFLEET